MIDDSPERKLFLAYFTVFTAEVLLLSVGNLPGSMSFRHFAFCDAGTNLNLQYLISQGRQPTIDFGYFYGLLSLLFGQVWLGTFGNTPLVYQAAMTACGLLIVLAFARIASHLRLGRFGIALIVIGWYFALPLAFPNYPNFSQALEAVLLCHGLAEQALGNKPRALAFSSAAVLAKPAMGYFYSLLLLILIAAELRGRSSDRLRASARALAPAALIFAGLLVILALDFGILPLVRTILPVVGMNNYGRLGYGFFTGKGRLFWKGYSTQGWLYYLRTPVGFWIFLTMYLVVAAIAALRKALSRSTFELRLKDELVVTCAVLHVAFVTLFFGNQWTWIYYPYLLILGAAAAVDIAPVYRRFAVPLLLIGAISLISPIHTFEKRWTQEVRGPATAGLWAPPKVSNEWNHVLDLVRGHRATALYSLGGVQLLFPQFGAPVSAFLQGGLANAAESERKVAQLSQANLVVVPLGAVETCFARPDLPRIDATLKDFAPLWKGKYFEVLRRDPTRASQPRQ